MHKLISVLVPVSQRNAIQGLAQKLRRLHNSHKNEADNMRELTENQIRNCSDHELTDYVENFADDILLVELARRLNEARTEAERAKFQGSSTSAMHFIQDELDNEN